MLRVADALLHATHVLPNGAATVYSAGFDLGLGAKGDHLALVELKITGPALTTGRLPDAATVIYTVQHDTDPAFGTVADLLPSVLTQTGAAGAGAALATWQGRLPVDVKQYIRIKCVKTNASDASAVSLIEELLF